MKRPVGIDLGTTVSVVAAVDEAGRVAVLADEDGERFIPSVVCLEEDEDDIVVGQEAKDNSGALSDSVVSCVKRNMGNPEWRFPYRDTAYSAAHISSFILRKMKETAEETLGEVRSAVITVPAYFLDAPRKATLEAARMAGLEVLKIINEPTAAAMAYGFLENQQDSTFLVYDLGGGTFDVTVMRARKGAEFEMLTTAGNHRLGGRDWDTCLATHISEQFAETHGENPRESATSFADLLLKAEKAKIALSQSKKTRIVCQHAGKSLTVEMTRQQFEELTDHLLQLTAIEVDLALQEAKLTSEQIDFLLLVGGSTKMPMVRRLMESKAKEIKMSRNPDEMVALGAAIEAARLANQGGADGLFRPSTARRLGEIEIKDRTPHALGMLAVSRGELRNTIIIPKDTPVPCERGRDDYATSNDDQDSIDVHLVQGGVQDGPAEACAPLASYTFLGIPPRPAGASRIRVTYRYNENTIVDVAAVDVASGQPLQQQSRPLVDVDEIAGGGGEGAPAPRAVALLLDASGSMSGRRMVEAKSACHHFIDKTDFDIVHVGIVQFGIASAANVWHPLSQDPALLKAAVDRLRASGGTPMAEAIACGQEMLRPFRGKRERFMVLFTDGQPRSVARVREAAMRVKEDDIKLICIGVHGADHGLLDQLATSDQDSVFANSGNELVNAFGNIAQVISGKRI